MTKIFKFISKPLIMFVRSFSRFKEIIIVGTINDCFLDCFPTQGLAPVQLLALGVPVCSELLLGSSISQSYRSHVTQNHEHSKLWSQMCVLGPPAHFWEGLGVACVLLRYSMVFCFSILLWLTPPPKKKKHFEVKPQSEWVSKSKLSIQTRTF